ncbi:MAG TPA: MotA/TolQ/ExbB proton channel family protein [Candidatus Brocadiia bacterium]|nr:MotA/TolQ/ExbB proton channel family protein [Candidatus Brocadiia bacterium]
MNWTNLSDWMTKGGQLMWPLAICSAAMMAAVIERLIMLRRSRVMPSGLIEAASRAETAADGAELLPRLKTDVSPLGRILLSVVENRELPRPEADVLAEAVGRAEARGLSRRLLVLEAVYVIAPMLGLLGTVVGLMVIFQDFSSAGSGEARAFSRGIAMALLTTVTGLLIAIPSYIAHIYFSHRVEDMAIEMENLATKLSAALRRSVENKG